MAHLLEMLRNPLTLGQRLEQDSHPWTAGKLATETLPRRGDASIDPLAYFGHIRIWLSFFGDRMAPYSMVGLLSCALSAFSSVERSYLAEETRRFILSTG